MESTTAPVPRTAPADGLRELFDRAGPFVTVVADTEADIENAAQLSMQRWRAQRDALTEAGAPASALDAIEALIPDAHLDGRALFVVAEPDGVLVAEPLSALPDAGCIARWSPLPSLVPLLEDRQARLPHVVVRCDREGADVLAVDAQRSVEPETVRGDRHPFRHARSVGWRELRGWHRAERTIENTAESIADAVSAAARRIEAKLVVVAGADETVLRVIERVLADGLDARAVRGGRGHDGSDDEVDSETARVVASVVAEHEVTVIERFKEQRAHDLAVEGPDDTLAALAAARVGVLLIHDDGTENAVIDDAVRAALASSAGVVRIPKHGGPRDGIGGLLRWA